MKETENFVSETLTEPGSSRPIAGRSETGGLRGNMGTTSVVFMTLACLSPLTAVAGYISFVIAYGNGLGAPLMYFAVGLVAILFAVGYLRMVRDLARPGGLYAYITVGLGKRIGLGGGYVAMITYLLCQVGLSIFAGIALNALITDQFGGADIPWYVCVAPFLLLIAIASYFNVAVSARLLGILLIVEMIFVVVFDIAVLGTSDPSHYVGVAESFTIPQLLSGAVPLAFLFALAQFSGFESPSLYFEETKNPQRTIPRATYIIVVFIAVLYAISALALIVGFVPETAVAAISADPTAAFPTLFTQYLGNGFYQICALVLQTGILASMLGTHNVLTRYVFNCGVDGVLPKVLGKANPRTGAPGIASVAVSVFVFTIVAISAIVGGDPNELLALLGGAGTYGFLLLFMLGGIAVIAYFARKRGLPGNPRAAFFLAPITATVFYALVLVYVTGDLNVLVHSENPAFGIILLTIVWLCFVGGIGQAIYLAARRPKVFARIGREDVLDTPPTAHANAEKVVIDE